MTTAMISALQNMAEIALISQIKNHEYKSIIY